MTQDCASALQRDCQTLLNCLRPLESVAVAYSGGVDSAVVARAAVQALGDNAVAVTAVSPSLAAGEREAAEALARQIGIRHLFINTSEFENPEYVRNSPDRCYHCKTELYLRLERLLPELGVAHLVNGANLDDRGDYRPGMQAAREHGVRSPLIEAGLTKQQVRALARYWQLPVWDKPASPCLSSRIAYGLEATPERVSRVDAAERYLRELMRTGELRVRHEAHDLARIEVPPHLIERFLRPDVRSAVCGKLRELGFCYVTLDLEGFRSGSMNAALHLVPLTLPGPSLP